MSPPPPAASEATVDQAEAPILSGVWRVALTPFLLALVVTGLALYLAGADLDTMEQRQLELDVIARAFQTQIELVAISTALVISIAIPLGIMLTRPFARAITPPVLAGVNIGQAVPSLGVLAVFAALFGLGRNGVIFALVLYCLLSVLRNTMVGLQQVDPALIEAARGMGMSKRRTLRKVELPLAVPVMLAGIRTALIINVGTATLATFSLGAPPDGSGGLGELINAGLRLDRIDTLVLTGAVLSAVLALFLDWVAGLVEDRLRPKGLR